MISLFRQLAELSLDGKVLTSFSHKELREPVSVAVSPTSGHWVVADIGARAVLVFEPSGKLVSFVYLWSDSPADYLYFKGRAYWRARRARRASLTGSWT